MKKYALFFLVYAFAATLYAQPNLIKQTIPQKSRILFLLDGSGSMNAKWDGDLRINIAKRKIADLIDSLKINPTIEFALRVYGHQSDSKLKNCQDSKLEVPFKANNTVELRKKLFSIQPKGVTPIAYSLEQSTKDFPDDSKNEYRNIILMITDGLESCQGDPCKISLSLQRKGVILKPFIIGLGVGKDFTKAFECIGKAVDAKTSLDFGQILSNIIRQTISKTSVSVDLLDYQNKATESNINMTFKNSTSDKIVYDIVHYKNKKGFSDTLEIDHLINYDLTINTIPPTVKSGIILEGGKHNVISVKIPQGTLQLQIRSAAEYGNNLLALIRLEGQKETLHHQKVNSSERYLLGTYAIEVLTTPRTYFSQVVIKPNETTILPIEQAGIVNIRNLMEGFGSIYALEESGEQKWVQNFSPNDKNMTLPLQPGRYKLVFRAKEAQGSVYTFVKPFSISAGGSASVDILK